MMQRIAARYHGSCIFPSDKRLAPRASTGHHYPPGQTWQVSRRTHRTCYGGMLVDDFRRVARLVEEPECCARRSRRDLPSCHDSFCPLSFQERLAHARFATLTYIETSWLIIENMGKAENIKKLLQEKICARTEQACSCSEKEAEIFIARTAYMGESGFSNIQRNTSRTETLSHQRIDRLWRTIPCQAPHRTISRRHDFRKLSRVGAWSY